MKHFFIILLFFSLASCSEEEGDDNSLVKASFSMSSPVAILATKNIPVGLDEYVELLPPWSQVYFTFENNSNMAVTIAAATYKVTDPLTGSVKTEALDPINIFTGAIRLHFATIRAKGDTDCNGIVEENEGPAIETCSWDTANISSDKTAHFISDFSGAQSSDGVSVSEAYRGLTFSGEMILEGWYGLPDEPISNFYKTFLFTPKAN